MCNYKEKKSEPSEMMQLDGYTVDYIEPASGECLNSIHFVCVCVCVDFMKLVGKFPADMYFWNLM